MSKEIKDLCAEIRATVDDEILSKISAQLKSIELKADEQTSTITAVSSESKNRKLKLREYKEKEEEWALDKEQWTKEKEELEQKADHSELSKKVTELEKFKTGVISEKRDSFVENFKVISQREDFEERIKPFYKLPEEKDEDGNLKWETLEPQDVEHNLEKYKEHEKLGLFTKSNFVPPDHKKGESHENLKTNEPKSISEAEANIAKYHEAHS